MSMLPQSSARRLVDALSRQCDEQEMPPLPVSLFEAGSPIWSGILDWRDETVNGGNARALAQVIDTAITAAMHDYGRVVAAECAKILEGIGPHNPMTANDCIDAIRQRFNLE